MSKARRELGIAPAPRGADTAWVAKHRHPLGQVSDPEVARRAGVSATRVASARRELGIRAFEKRPHIAIKNAPPLTAALLRSSRSAPELSRLTGICTGTIRGRRRKLGIPTPNRPEPAWIAKAQPLLGKVSDTEISRRVGVSGATVGALRQRMGIARVPQSSPHRLSAAQIRHARAVLTGADRVVFEGRFVADPPRSLAAIGRELGVSKQRVAARERGILAIMRSM